MFLRTMKTLRCLMQDQEPAAILNHGMTIRLGVNKRSVLSAMLHSEVHWRKVPDHGQVELAVQNLALEWR